MARGVTWPSKQRLEYARLLLTVILLLIVTPLAVWHFITNPEKAAARTAAAL